MKSDKTEYDQVVESLERNGVFEKEMPKTKAYGFIASMRGLLRMRKEITPTIYYKNKTNTLTIKTNELCKD